MSAYTLISLQSPTFAALGHVASPPPDTPQQPPPPDTPLDAHPAWDTGNGWKHRLNNLRLLLQPDVCACLLLP